MQSTIVQPVSGTGRARTVATRRRLLAPAAGGVLVAVTLAWVLHGPVPAPWASLTPVEDGSAQAVSQLAREESAATPIYALTITGSRCSVARVDRVPVMQDPTRIYGSGEDIVEIYSQLCSGAAH